MKIALHLQDREYPFTKTTHVREIARSLLKNEKGEYALHHIVRDDLFGAYSYFETPGGGVDEGETPAIAVVRECLEETGYQVKILAEIGYVEDYYNLLGRENHNHFFLCETRGIHHPKRFVSTGDDMIKETLWLPLGDVIAHYESVPSAPLPNLVKARELPFWKALGQENSSLG